MTRGPESEQARGDRTTTARGPSARIDGDLGEPFSLETDVSFADALRQSGGSLVMSTYQAGKVIVLSPSDSGVVQLPKTFPGAMGLAAGGHRLAVAGRDSVVVLENEPGLVARHPRRPAVYDAVYLPTVTIFTGPLAIHEMSWGEGDALVVVDTAFSCLAWLGRLGERHLLWRPRWVSRLAPEDRCHLNGVAMSAGLPRFVTALAVSDEASGWRGTRLSGGVVVDVESNEVAVSGLSMPHSPRWADGRLLVLQSARCELLSIDPARGDVDVVCRVPGFARGLAITPDFFFVGLSSLRHDRATFGDLPIARAEGLFCGVAAIERASGRLVGSIRYQSSCTEISDLQFLPDRVRPGLSGLDDPLLREVVRTPIA